MNPVECHAGPLQVAAMAGSDWSSWGEVDEAFRSAAAPDHPREQGLREGVPEHPSPGQQTSTAALDTPLGPEAGPLASDCRGLRGSIAP